MEDDEIMTLYVHFKESGMDLPYSPDHHVKDINFIKQVIKTNNSLLVLGLSGSGKSSLLRFLVSNPSVQSKDMVFIYIDCNRIDWDRKTEAIQEEIFGLIVEHLIAQGLSDWGIGRARPVLQYLLEELALNGPTHLVIIFDRSELLQQVLSQPFFNHLRALRDLNPRLSYIFGGRHLNPETFGELADILWHEPRWIGALTLDDARMTINRHLTRLEIGLEAEEVEKILTCVGRHPQLLKYACELVKADMINLNDSEMKIVKQLAESSQVKRQCMDLWQDLSFEAQNMLRGLTLGQESRPSPIVEWLVDCGILNNFENGGKVTFNSPVFEVYVSNLGPPPLTLENEIVFKGAETLDLSKEEYELFKILWDNQPQVISTDQISETVWSNAQGEVSPQMITTLVKRLREKLGDTRYINNIRGRGYQFVQGTAPLPREPNNRQYAKLS